MLFSDLFSKFPTFPSKPNETSEIELFHKRPKIFYQKCSSYNYTKVRGWLWIFFKKAEKLIWLVNEPLEMLAKNIFANNKKVSIFHIFFSEKNFWGRFFSQKKSPNLLNPSFWAKTPRWWVLPIKNQCKILLIFLGGHCCYQKLARIQK